MPILPLDYPEPFARTLGVTLTRRHSTRTASWAVNVSGLV
jgi:hypothetical protein